MISFVAMALVLVATIIGSLASFFFKKGAKDLSLTKLITNYYLLLGVFLYGLATIFYVSALKFEEITIVYPLTAVSYVWTAIISVRFLKEKMNPFKWCGIILIILGVYFIVR